MEMNNQSREIVYVLTNEVMPGLVKIGLTSTSIEQRMMELYKTGVPVPFECFRASVVHNGTDVEGRLHRAFAKFRVNKNREFFEMEPQSVVEILELVEIENVTPTDEVYETPDDIVALKNLEERKERFSFNMVDISPGVQLTLSKDETKVATVVDNNKVLYNGVEMSLSEAAKVAINEMGYNWKAAQGPAYWMYEGETLKERRERMETE